jgi:hypothetical protein
MPDQPKPRRDLAADAGRVAGRVFSRVGVRLLRTKPFREAVRRAHEEATRDDDAEVGTDGEGGR